MGEVVPDKPHLGWKLYWGLSALLTVGALPLLVIRPSWASCLHEVMAFVTLTGLFGYAWAVKVPGPRIFWRGVAVVSAVLILIDLTGLITRAGPHASAQIMQWADPAAHGSDHGGVASVCGAHSRPQTLDAGEPCRAGVGEESRPQGLSLP